DNVQNQDHSSGETFAYSVEQFIHAAYYNYAQTTALLAKGSAAALNDFAATGGQYLQWHPGFSGNQRAYFPAMRRTLLCVPQVFFKVTPRSTIPQRRAPAYERREVAFAELISEFDDVENVDMDEVFTPHFLLYPPYHW
ncbi:hypothetical protein Tcan_02948, partial [Toxocara canis]